MTPFIIINSGERVSKSPSHAFAVYSLTAAEPDGAIDSIRGPDSR